MEYPLNRIDEKGETALELVHARRETAPASNRGRQL